MKKCLIISTVAVVLTCALLLCGGVAFAATNVEGFINALNAILDALRIVISGIIELFKVIA